MSMAMPILHITYVENGDEYQVTLIPSSTTVSAVQDGQLNLSRARDLIQNVLDSIEPPPHVQGERSYRLVSRGRVLPEWDSLDPVVRESFARAEEALEVLEIGQIIRRSPSRPAHAPCD